MNAAETRQLEPCFDDAAFRASSIFNEDDIFQKADTTARVFTGRDASFTCLGVLDDAA